MMPTADASIQPTRGELAMVDAYEGARFRLGWAPVVP